MRLSTSSFHFLFFSLLCQLVPLLRGGLMDFFEGDHSEHPSEYGVDVSFPIHHNINRHHFAQHYARYEQLLRGCYDRYGRDPCDATERARMAMNLQQPRMQHNYTVIGFKKTRVPDAIWAPLLSFFHQNRDREKMEDWPAGSTYVNHWVSPSYMISFEDSSLRGGLQLKSLIWNAVKPIIEQWVGYPVEPTSLYGIRIYKRGAVLATHVDRLPLVTSAILQIAQELDFDWPLEVYDHDGRAHNVTMVPGDMVLYESHSVLHGRPFPLQGNSYANVFVHFKPREHDALTSADLNQLQQPPQHPLNGYNIGGHEQNNHPDLPHLQRPAQAFPKQLPSAAKPHPQSHPQQLNVKEQLLSTQRKHREMEERSREIVRETELQRHDDPFRRRFTGPRDVPSANYDKNANTNSNSFKDRRGEAERNTVARGKEEAKKKEWQRTWLQQIVKQDYQKLIQSLKQACDSLSGGRDAVLQLVNADTTDTDQTNSDSNHVDSNGDVGWTLLHEAVRSDCLVCAELLIKNYEAKVDIKVRQGGDARWLARQLHSDTQHPMQLLLWHNQLTT